MLDSTPSLGGREWILLLVLVWEDNVEPPEQNAICKAKGEQSHPLL